MKRDDLQAIRGVAILLVLLFHLHPTRFPLGFVGVDIFFVLSGFLMALILSKEEITHKTFLIFYSRRFRRIVPVYYVCLLGAFLGCASILLPSDKEQLLFDLKWALSFLSNIQPFYEVQGYWDQVTSYRLLVHCWSLGVEIQFYLMAPFLIAITNKLSSHWRIFTLLFLIVISLLFQTFAPAKISYDLLPSRIWQFLLGILCYKKKEGPVVDLVEKEKLLEEDDNDPPVAVPEPRCTRTHIVCELALGFLILAIAVNPAFLTKNTIRIFGCLITCAIIRCPAPPSISFLSNRFLVFLGDLSYAMYLIHWPIIVATKYYYNITTLRVDETFLLLLVIFLITLVIHYIIENPLISSGLPAGILVCFVSAAVILLSGPYYKNCCMEFPSNVTEGDINITEAIEFNLQETDKIYYPIPCEPDTVTPPWTNWTLEPQLRCQTYSNGTLKILVMGNSIAYRAFPLIKEVLNGRYKELRLFSRSASPTLSDKHPEVTAAAHIVADKMRPDIIWNIHCDYDDIFIRPFVNKSTDPAFLAFQKHLDFYQARTKHIIIDLPYYWSDVRVCYELVRCLQLGLPLEQLKIPKIEAEKQQTHHQARLLSLNCTKCSYNAVENLLWEDDIYWFYNRANLHGYTKDGQHFTPEFLKKLKPMYQKAIDEVLKRLELEDKH